MTITGVAAASLVIAFSINAVAAASFERMDTSGDGAFDEAEIGMEVQRQLTCAVIYRLAKVDANGDGLLSETEVPKRDRTAFRSAEKNADGLATSQAIAAATWQLLQRGGTAQNFAKGVFDMSDTDADGGISPGEIDAWPPERWIGSQPCPPE